MSKEKESMATRVARRALDLHDRVVERALKELMTPPIGTQAVGARKVRNLIRLALEGNPWALAEVGQLAMQNGHQPGEPEPCPVCEQIAAVIAAVLEWEKE